MNIKGTSPICKNCGTPTHGKYCHECGQATKTGRINFHYVLHEAQHSIFHVDRGILFTIKELLLRPGTTIRNYLEGKRVGVFKPFAFVIILGTVYGLIAHFFEVYPETSLQGIYSPSSEEQIQNKLVYDWMYSHYSMVMLFYTPFFAFGSFLVFRRAGYNYMEHLILCCYIVGIEILIFITTYFIFYFIQSLWILTLSYLLVNLYHVWVYVQFFSEQYALKVIVKTIISIVLSMALLIVVCAIAIFCFLLFRQLSTGNIPV